MIYDCFTFFNELELLELRLHELADVVDRFVLVESTRTFTNKPKPLYFDDNRALFADFGDRIMHIVVRDSPDVSDPWMVERFQRNCIARGLTKCRPDDWVLVSDVDEIPRASVVKSISREAFDNNFLVDTVHGVVNSKLAQAIVQRRGIRRLWRRSHPFVWKFQQTLFRYFLNCRALAPWYGTRMARFRDFSCAEEMRHSGRRIVPDAGWHFTYMGGANRVRQKLAAYSHQENNQPELSEGPYLQYTINAAISLFGKSKGKQLEFVELDDSFPRYLRENPEKFSKLLKPV